MPWRAASSFPVCSAAQGHQHCSFLRRTRVGGCADSIRCLDSEGPLCSASSLLRWHRQDLASRRSLEPRPSLPANTRDSRWQRACLLQSEPKLLPSLPTRTAEQQMILPQRKRGAAPHPLSDSSSRSKMFCLSPKLGYQSRKPTVKAESFLTSYHSSSTPPTKASVHVASCVNSVRYYRDIKEQRPIITLSASRPSLLPIKKNLTLG